MAKKNSTSGRAMCASVRKKKSETNWQNAIRRAVTVIPFSAGCVAVDCDSVILHHDPDDGYHLGQVLAAGAELVSQLKQRGFRVIVLTARHKGHQDLLLHLAKNQVWVDKVTDRKPYADAYFDDKAVRVEKNWR